MKPHITAILIALLGAVLTTNQSANAEELPGLGVQSSDYFYTGKPYDEDLESYVFAFRDYDPEVNRWTSADPSGFPDGANNVMYAPNPTYQLDPSGLLKMDTLVATGGPQWTPPVGGYALRFDEYSVLCNDGTTRIKVYDYEGGWGGAAADWSFNCAGYVFADSIFWIPPEAKMGNPTLTQILIAEGYKRIDGPCYAGATVALWGNEHIAKVTEIDGCHVEKVVGKKGATVGLTAGTPAGQWSGGIPSYWE